jgi:nucleotide-binding universal stress UspA family protein
VKFRGGAEESPRADRGNPPDGAFASQSRGTHFARGQVELVMHTTIRKILVPIDFSTRSRLTADYARTLAGSLGTTVHLIHVVEQPFTSGPPYNFHLPDTPVRREQLYQRARARLGELANTLRVDGIEASVEVRFGTAVEEILKAAVDYGADVIVMGSQGRSALQQLIVSGVSDEVIRRAPCPVLAVREHGGATTSVAA